MSGGDSCGGGYVCDLASAFQHQQVIQGKSPAGTKPADKSGSTSSTGGTSSQFSGIPL